MRAVKLTRQEKVIEEDLLKGHYVSVDKKEFHGTAQALAVRKKDAVLNIRINRSDLDNIKQKAKKLGVKYQTFISEILHKIAQA